MLKFRRQDQLYHHGTAYDHSIAYAQLAFVVVDMEAVINYPSAKNYGMQKGTLMSCLVEYKPVDVLYSALLDSILCS